MKPLQAVKAPIKAIIRRAKRKRTLKKIKRARKEFMDYYAMYYLSWSFLFQVVKFFYQDF